MLRSYFDRNTPIAALATPEGRSALAVVRTSGASAIELVARCFSNRQALLNAQPYQAVYGWFIDPATGEQVDEVIELVFRAPHSFTGENAVEIMSHGSPAVVERILDVLYAQGFSPALHGEFSFRAFLQGKTDLVRAEAINELTHASCEAARHDALQRLSGALSRKLAEIRDLMVDLLADINAKLDYPEDEGPEESSRWLEIMQDARDALSVLIQSYHGGRLRQEGFLVVIAGRPNAGKSSLFNLFAREERAIVSPEPGTTRDWIETWISIGEFAVRLVDTAGLRRSQNMIEAEGVRRSQSLLERADVILYLVDGVAGLNDEDREFAARHPEALLLWNKADLSRCLPPPEGWIPLSAKDVRSFGAFENIVIDKLRSYARTAQETGTLERQIRIASERQADLLKQSEQALSQALEAYTAGAGLDLVALHIREAAEAIGEITGDIAADEVLERVFSTFCLGK
jgi:tRNA modification GTPase